MASGEIPKYLTSENFKAFSVTLTEDLIVPANDRAVIYVDGKYYSTHRICIGGQIVNYNTSHLYELIVYGAKWYDDNMLYFYNPTSASITIPAGTEIIYMTVQKETVN